VRPLEYEEYDGERERERDRVPEREREREKDRERERDQDLDLDREGVLDPERLERTEEVYDLERPLARPYPPRS